MILTITGAAVLLMAGHVVRAVRWQTLTAPFMHTRLSQHLLALTAGYSASLILPFRLGELARIWLFTRLSGVPLAHSAASVVIDRLLDVAVIFALITLMFGLFALPIVLMFILGVAVALTLLLVVDVGFVKKGIGWGARVFNPALERHILAFAWALQQIMRHVLSAHHGFYFLILTLVMWVFYLASVVVFCWGQGFGETLFFIERVYSLTQEGRIAFWHIGQAGWASDSLTIYLLLSFIPLIGAVAYVALRPTETLRAFVRGVGTLGLAARPSPEAPLTRLSLYLNPEDELAFLRAWAHSADAKALLLSYRHNQDVQIIRNLSGGSMASVLLVEKAGQRFFRKFAVGGEALRLKGQLHWLTQHQKNLPLTSVQRPLTVEGFTSYDMPYSPEAYGLFDYIHTHTPDQSWTVLKRVLGVLETRLHGPTRKAATSAQALQYLEEKLWGALNRTLEAAPALADLAAYDTLDINGKKVPNIFKIAASLKPTDFLPQLDLSCVCDVHGDLTIENIIYTPNQPQGFYLIDPLDGHAFSSRYLDYAKLRQSLVGGYEFLITLPSVRVEGNKIFLPVLTSQAYTTLAAKLDAHITQTFGAAALEEVKLHTLVYWCRLLPYRAKYQPRALPAYIAVASLLAQSLTLPKKKKNNV